MVGKTPAVLMMSLLAALMLAPTTSAAAPVAVAVGNCPPPNPDAWVNACVEFDDRTQNVNAYRYNKNPDTTDVCPVNNICVYPPVLLDLIERQTYSVDYIMVVPHVSTNLGNVIQDACDVIGINCNISEIIASLVSVEMNDQKEQFLLVESGDDAVLMPLA